MATIESKDSVVPPAAAPAPQATAVPLSPPHSSGREETLPKPSMDAYPKPSMDAYDINTPPFSPASDTPVLQKEQEDFEGIVHVNNDLPTEKELSKVEDLLILDAQGKSRPFKELYDASGVAPRQLIIFIRPQIIRDGVDAMRVAEELRTKLRGRLGTTDPNYRTR